MSVVAKATNGFLDEFTAANGERFALVREGEFGAGRMLGGETLRVMAGQWGIRIGLSVAYFLLFLLLSKMFGKSGFRAGFKGVALACVVMTAIWFMHRPGNWLGLAFLPVAAAALGLGTRSGEKNEI